MAKTGSDIIQIMRNVTGRVDASDPLFTDTIMLGYANDFLNLIMPQEVRLNQNQTWWEFTISPTDLDPFPVDLAALGFTTIGPPAYANGFKLWWYQAPSVFYSIWPETQTYTPQRPEYVLYYNNTLTFRGPPNQSYNIKIQAYKVEAVLAAGSESIDTDYFWRYVAYGASLDIFSDFGETAKYQELYPAFQRYKSIVYARTNAQLMNQRAYPTF